MPYNKHILINCCVIKRKNVSGPGPGQCEKYVADIMISFDSLDSMSLTCDQQDWVELHKL